MHATLGSAPKSRRSLLGLDKPCFRLGEYKATHSFLRPQIEVHVPLSGPGFHHYYHLCSFSFTATLPFYSNNHPISPSLPHPHRGFHTLMPDISSLGYCFSRLMFPNCLQFEIRATSSFSPWSAGLMRLRVGDSSTPTYRPSAVAAAQAAEESRVPLHQRVSSQAWGSKSLPLTI